MTVPAATHVDTRPGLPRCRTAGGGVFARFVGVCLGVVLLAAACLKLYGLDVTPVPRVGWFATPQVQVVTAEWEIVLGAWLLSGWNPRGAWWAAIGTFAAFAGVSGYFGCIGVASCGCFGVIHASPWAAFAVDLTALSLLAITRQRGRNVGVPPTTGWATIPVGAAGILILLTAVGTLAYGSPAAALARLRGDVVTVSPDYVDFGGVSEGQSVERKVEVWNWTDGPVRLIGGSSDCTCVTTADLPLTIPPRERRAVTIRVNIPKTKPGVVVRKAELWTDHLGAPRVRLLVSFREI
jgi:hypothetical protein